LPDVAQLMVVLDAVIYVDVTHPQANKGAVSERLSRYYKIPLEQIATFGDGANDVLISSQAA
jgi:hydroxymethylpyrimidine pyrophosphatase-like HAD family hydrolase